MANKRDKMKINFSLELDKTSEIVSAPNKIEASTSDPAPKPPNAAGSSTKKETKPNNCVKCKGVEVVCKRQSIGFLCRKCLTKKINKCEKCQCEGTVEKFKKHVKYFCDKCEICGPDKVDKNFVQTHKDILQENNKLWSVNVTGKWQWCIVKGDFGTAICHYNCYKDTFAFEVYTDIPWFELYKYKMVIHWPLNGKYKQKTLETQFEEIHDWKLTMGNAKNEGLIKDFKIKVSICLKPEFQSDSAVAN